MRRERLKPAERDMERKVTAQIESCYEDEDYKGEEEDIGVGVLHGSEVMNERMYNGRADV